MSSGDARSVELSEKPAAAGVDDVTCDVDLAAEPAKTDAEEAGGDAAREAAAAEAEASAPNAPHHPAARPLSQKDLAVLATIARGSGSAHECKEV